MIQDNWNDLIIERVARPQPLLEERFREWVAGKGVFISSRRDAEMNPIRDAGRKYLYGIGAHPVMWEEMTPKDETSEQAYLNGVEQSEIFVLLIGRSYGVADKSGYSPIHKEGNKAAFCKIPRLLFMLEGIQDSERDGRLNDWLFSLYEEVSVASFATPESFVAQLDAQLREMAARSYRLWIKLGNLVFPGSVKTDSLSSRRGNRFTVTARVTQGSLRYALLSLSEQFSSSRASINRLTWSDQSFPIQIDSVSTEAEFTTDNVVRINCTSPQNSQSTTSSSCIPISINGSVHGRSLGPADLAKIWARQAILGETMEAMGVDGSVASMALSFSAPSRIPLPGILQANNATGWLAEGLTRLYMVEEFRRRYSGYFEYLNIGSATAIGVRVDCSFVFDSSAMPDNRKVQLQGVVPIRC